LIFREIKDPLNEPATRANILMLISLFFNTTAGITAISNHRNYEVRWIYNFIAREKAFEAINGGFKVLWHHILIPSLFIFSSVYLASTGEVIPVLIHISTTALMLKIFFNLTALSSICFPFSRRIEKLSSADKILIQFSSFIAVIFAVLLQRGFYRAILDFKSPYVAIFMLGFLIFSERYTGYILKQRAKEFAWETGEE